MIVDDISRQRAATSEITFLAPIRSGVIPDLQDKLRYSDRLKVVLDVFNEREDYGVQPVPLALRAFRGIHFAHLTMLDGDSRFLFSVDFDGSFHDYLAGLACEMPHLLHLVFSNCVGWERVDDNPAQLIHFVRSYQVKTNFWYAHAPHLSVVDIEWLDTLRRELSAAAPDLNIDRLLARVSQAGAPRTLERRLAQLFENQPNQATSLLAAKSVFKQLFARLYTQPEWTAAYAETFGVQP